jgi:PIN domain nuclease of toxin-antitoxin system
MMHARSHFNENQHVLNIADDVNLADFSECKISLENSITQSFNEHYGNILGDIACLASIHVFP